MNPLPFRSRKISKVLTTLKIESGTKWTWSGTGFVRDLPSEEQAAVPNRLQLYKRARYYDPSTGEFISRDPLEYVDGMSLYRGYFVPGATDPFGLKAKDPCTSTRRNGFSPLKPYSLCDKLACAVSKIIFAKDKWGKEAWHRYTTGDGSEWKLNENHMKQIKLNFAKETKKQKKTCCKQAVGSSSSGFRLLRKPWKTTLGTVGYKLNTSCSQTTCDAGGSETTLSITDYYDWDSKWLKGKKTHRSAFGEGVTVSFELYGALCLSTGVWKEYSISGSVASKESCAVE